MAASPVCGWPLGRSVPIGRVGQSGRETSADRVQPHDRHHLPTAIDAHRDAADRRPMILEPGAVAPSEAALGGAQPDSTTTGITYRPQSMHTGTPLTGDP